MDKIILSYSSKEDLINKIIKEYLKEIKSQVKSNKKVLADKNWASDDSDYHIECREDLKNQINECEKQLQLLK